MILIVSNSYDLPTVEPVVRALERRGADVVVYNSDLVASGKIAMSYVLGADGSVTISYGGRVFSADEVEAAWYRRPNTFHVGELDTVKELYLARQRKDCQDALWYAISPEKWLNYPPYMDIAENKGHQLQLARKLKMSIPPMVITNDWKQLDVSLPQEKLIIKMPYGVYHDKEAGHFLATTVIDMSRREQLRETVPFPALWQPFLSKRREWRVTVVGNVVFPVAIYTADDARDDWRKHQFDATRVSFKREVFPVAAQRKCIRMLKKLHIGYGAFDFIEDEKGELIFLEVNTHGQYQWLVDEVGLAIPEAIANELWKKRAVSLEN